VRLRDLLVPLVAGNNAQEFELRKLVRSSVYLVTICVPLLFLALPLNVAAQQTVTVTVGDPTVNNGLSFVDANSHTSSTVINAGDTVHWDWGGNPMPHSTTSGTCVGAVCQTTPFWDSGEFVTGAGHTFDRTFNNSGLFPYFCTVHDSSMTGTVRVLPAPAAFALQSPIPVGTNPLDIVAADFNKDGILDLAVANRNNNTVTILLGDGHGNFTPAPGSPISGFNGPNSIAVADFNNDGNLDLVVSNGNDSSGNLSVAILLGNGDGTFGAASTLPVGMHPQAVIAADFNGDGNADLAVTVAPNVTPLTANVKVLRGNGSGGFAGPLSLSTNAPNPTSMAAFDFNQDNKLDLAVVNTSSGPGGNSISIFLNNSTPGAISFGSASNFSAGQTPHGITAGMFNDSQGTPTPGIAVPGFGGNTVGVFLADSVGNFTPASGSPFTVGSTAAPSPFAIVSADFNGDGLLDLAVSNIGENTVTALMNDGAGSFTSLTTTPSEALSSPRAIAVGDFNDDGEPDLVLANFATNDISILLNNTPLFPPPPPQPATHFGIAVQSNGPLSPEGNPTTTAGLPVQITVTAYDAYQRVATGYRGTVQFDSSDPQALPSAGLPANYTFTGADNGIHMFTVTLKTAGIQTVDLQDAGNALVNGRSSDILVNQAAASTFIVSAPTSVSAGNPFNFSVTAMDAYGNLATNYSGTVDFSSSDTNGCVHLPSPSTLTNGTGTFTAKLITTGSQTLTATDMNDSSIRGTSNSINVATGSIHFIVSPSANPAVVGQPISITVSAVNTCDNVQTGYTGTVDNFVSTDSFATLLGLPYPFTVGDNGVHTFTNDLTFHSTGMQTVTVRDTFHQFSGTSPVVTVVPASTTVTLAVPPKQFLFRQSITLTATVQVTAPGSGTPTGTVSFFDGAVPLGTSSLSGTQAIFTSSQWKIGKHSFTAVYNGDTNFLASPSSAVVVQYKSPKPH
jgi:plastocyanin